MQIPGSSPLSDAAELYALAIKFALARRVLDFFPDYPWARQQYAEAKYKLLQIGNRLLEEGPRTKCKVDPMKCGCGGRLEGPG